jgi:hypothetical protein
MAGEKQKTTIPIGRTFVLGTKRVTPQTCMTQERNEFPAIASSLRQASGENKQEEKAARQDAPKRVESTLAVR